MCAAGRLGSIRPVESDRFQLHPEHTNERLRHLSVLQPPGGQRPKGNCPRDDQKIHTGQYPLGSFLKSWHGVGSTAITK